MKMRVFVCVLVASLALLSQDGEAFQLRGINALGSRDFVANRLDTLLDCKSSKHSETARDLLFESSGHWKQCRKDIEPTRKAASTVNDKVSKVHNALVAIEALTDSTAKTAKVAAVTARKSLSKLQSIPKVGKVVKVMIEAIEKAAQKLQNIDDKVAKVEDIVSRVKTGTTAVSLQLNAIALKTTVRSKALEVAGEFQNTLIACTAKTKTCRDNLNMENANRVLIPGLKTVETVSEICPRTFEKISGVMNALTRLLDLGIFDKLEELIENVKKAIEPIIKKIKDIIDKIGRFFSEAYCCTVPLLGQVFFKGIGQVLDLATCPVDSLKSGLDKAMQALIDFVNNALLSFVRKLLQKLPEVEFKIPVVTEGKLEASTCTFDLPSVELESVNLLEPIQAVFASEDPSLGEVEAAFINIGTTIRNDCKDALKELGKGLTEDCCKTFRPLRDGLFCDPTNHIPFKRCSQCKSGKFSFHVKKAHVACGIDDTIKDIATDVGDGIKDAADKVGSTATKVGKTIGKGVKSAGKKIKKFFG